METTAKSDGILQGMLLGVHVQTNEDGSKFWSMSMAFEDGSVGSIAINDGATAQKIAEAIAEARKAGKAETVMVSNAVLRPAMEENKASGAVQRILTKQGDPVSIVRRLVHGEGHQIVRGEQVVTRIEPVVAGF